MKYKLKTREDIIKNEIKYRVIRKWKYFKDESQYKNRFCRDYKKKFNEFLEYQPYGIVQQYFKTYGIYYSINKLQQHNLLKCEIDKNGHKAIKTKYVEDELFRREMCNFVDWKVWIDGRVKFISKKLVKKRKKESSNYLMVVPGRKKFLMGKFDGDKHWLAKKVYEYLKENLYVFDKSSPYYLSDEDIRTIIKSNFRTGRGVEKNLKLLALKRHLSRAKNVLLKEINKFKESKNSK